MVSDGWWTVGVGNVKRKGNGEMVIAISERTGRLGMRQGKRGIRDDDSWTQTEIRENQLKCNKEMTKKERVTRRKKKRKEPREGREKNRNIEMDPKAIRCDAMQYDE